MGFKFKTHFSKRVYIKVIEWKLMPTESSYKRMQMRGKTLGKKNFSSK